MTIRIKDSTTYQDGKQNVDIALASTDTKPTDVATGSTCVETDTGKHYVFDEDSGDWTEEQTSGGGGGGGGDSDFTTAEITFHNNTEDVFRDLNFRACLLDEYDPDEYEVMWYTELYITSQSTFTGNVVLYKGKAHIMIGEYHSVDHVTGGIAADVDEGMYAVTGNGDVYIGR